MAATASRSDSATQAPSDVQITRQMLFDPFSLVGCQVWCCREIHLAPMPGVTVVRASEFEAQYLCSCSCPERYRLLLLACRSGESRSKKFSHGHGKVAIDPKIDLRFRMGSSLLPSEQGHPLQLRCHRGGCEVGHIQAFGNEVHNDKPLDTLNLRASSTHPVRCHGSAHLARTSPPCQSRYDRLPEYHVMLRRHEIHSA